MPQVDECFFKKSLRGIPLLIVRCGKSYYSICYFLKYKKFKIYTNPKPYYKGKDSMQESIKITTGKEVFLWFKNYEENKEVLSGK